MSLREASASARAREERLAVLGVRLPGVLAVQDDGHDELRLGRGVADRERGARRSRPRRRRRSHVAYEKPMRSERTRSRKKIAGDATPASCQGRKSSPRAVALAERRAARRAATGRGRASSERPTRRRPRRGARARVSESAPSGGHMPFGRKPKCLSNVERPSASCERASSGCEKRGDGERARRGATPCATPESARSGRIGWWYGLVAASTFPPANAAFHAGITSPRARGLPVEERVLLGLGEAVPALAEVHEERVLQERRGSTTRDGRGRRGRARSASEKSAPASARALRSA